ncbi:MULTISPECIES: hypothetical protein [unclassified Brevibacterium]|uniref:hypothetical protein n=1 Tax=unclassified Brevibacterium TaxID=2614124 RepID=UPI001092C2C0|nr:hypothetical protein [Brevibacterium sp. S22]TGD31647.1 hypothetical protein EB835_07890 [Brevibacterium sp. S22]
MTARTAAGALALTILLSGCSVFQIRTEDKSAGPVRVGVQETAGPEPTGKPTEAGVPEGMSRTSVSFGDSCPVDLSFALGDEWTESSGSTEQFHFFSRGDGSTRSDVILVNCTDEYGDSAQEVVDKKRRFNFSKQDSQVLAEQTGSLAAGEFWSYQAELGPTEILALDSEPTYAFGVQTGYKINGRLVNLSIEMRTLKDNTESAEDYKKMLPTVTIDGEKVPSPSFG